MDRNRNNRKRSHSGTPTKVGIEKASVAQEEDPNKVWDHGEYMAAKKAKLHQQFNRSFESGNHSSLFAGVSIYINGFVIPTNLRTLFTQHGGDYHAYASSSTDFVIASNLCDSSKRKWGSVTVRPEWITDSIAAGKLLDHKDYFLYNFNAEKKQKTLLQSLQNISDKKVESVSISNKGKANGEGFPANGSPEVMIIPNGDSLERNNGASTSSGNAHPTNSPAKTAVRLQAWEDGFLEEFYDHSRLHHISTMKKDLQKYIGRLRANAKNFSFVELQKYEEYIKTLSNAEKEFQLLGDAPVLFLVDLDCFFVAVGRLTRPNVVNKPVAVTHSTSKTGSSNADIACASYEARKFGVRNGMWVSDAKVLCPELEVIPYEFSAYQRVSMDFCRTLTGFTLDIEPGSCDEMLLDVTSILKNMPGSSPTSLAAFIRTRIFETTGCNASIGIGRNRQMAKLASKKAKPNGIFSLSESDMLELMKVQPVRDLNGAGYSTCNKLEKELNVRTCGDLQTITKQQLQKMFGTKKGEMLYNACRGIDNQTLNFDCDKPQSISVNVNYGVRLEETWQANKLVSNICRALCKRAEEAGARAAKLQLTLLTRMKDAPEPSKMGGHGYVNTHNRTLTFMGPTRSEEKIAKAVMSLLRQMEFPASDYRGIAVSLSNLSFDKDGGLKGQRTLNFATLSKPKSSRTENEDTCASDKNGNKSALIPPETKEKDFEDNFANNGAADHLSESFLEALPSPLRKEVVEDFNHIQAFKEGSKAPSLVVPKISAEKTASVAVPPSIQSHKVDLEVVNGSDTSNARDTQEKIAFRAVRLQENDKESGDSWHHVNWWFYNQKDDLPTVSNTKGYSMVTSNAKAKFADVPSLNGKVNMLDIRNSVYNAMQAAPVPKKSDLSGLIGHLDKLIQRYLLKDLQLLLSFLTRLTQNGTANQKWCRILTALIRIAQVKIKTRFGYHLQLTPFEDVNKS